MRRAVVGVLLLAALLLDSEPMRICAVARSWEGPKVRSDAAPLGDKFKTAAHPMGGLVEAAPEQTFLDCAKPQDTV